MNYQLALTIPYIFRLVSELIEVSNMSVDNQLNIVNHQDKFYIQDSKQNLHFIQEENANKLPHDFIKNLNTLIHFEKYKKRPIESTIHFKKLQSIHLGRKTDFDFNLLSTLQLQFATDSSYFDS